MNEISSDLSENVSLVTGPGSRDQSHMRPGLIKMVKKCQVLENLYQN